MTFTTDVENVRCLQPHKQRRLRHCFTAHMIIFSRFVTTILAKNS